MPPPPGHLIPSSRITRTGSVVPGIWNRPINHMVVGLRNWMLRTSIPSLSRTINECSSGCFGLKALSGNAWNSLSIILQIDWLFVSRIVAVKRINPSRLPIDRNDLPFLENTGLLEADKMRRSSPSKSWTVLAGLPGGSARTGSLPGLKPPKYTTFGSLGFDSVAYLITTPARIQRNNVPAKAVVIAAAFTCVEVIIAPIRAISIRAKPMPEFCTHPLENA